jgi:hypothetical protein
LKSGFGSDFAAAEISASNFEKTFPRFWSVISFLCLMPAQCEWPDMGEE